MLYRNFASQEALDAQYNLESIVLNVGSYADFYALGPETVVK